VYQLAVIDSMLADSRGVTLAELAAACRCHERSVRRYLAWMRDTLGVSPVETLYAADRRYFYAHGQTPIFTKAIGQILRGRVAAEEVMT
jgi:hypothetical protein